MGLIKICKKKMVGKNGISEKLLHETRGHYVTVETKTGSSYLGLVEKFEGNWNLILVDSIITKNDTSEKMDVIMLRGSNINYVAVPYLFKYSPLFQIKRKLIEKNKFVSKICNASIDL